MNLIHDTAIVIVDISGYTRFLLNSRTSVEHAQEIVFSLLESIVEKSHDPLLFN